MKIRSLIQQIKISEKEILLNKKTKQSSTSEIFFNIMPQPKNTCPLIDNTLSTIKSELKEINGHEEDFNDLFNLTIKADVCNCDSEEVFKANQQNLTKTSQQMSEVKETLEQLKTDLEVLRKDCERLRYYGDDLKEILWNYNSEKNLEDCFKTLNELQKPTLTFSEKNFLTRLDYVKIYLPYFKEATCSQGCSNYHQNSNLEELFDTFGLEINLLSDLKGIFKNYYLIESWVNALENLISDKTLPALFEELTPIQEDQFIHLYNEKQKQLYYESFTTELLSSVSLIQEINDFIDLNEDLNTAKRVETLVEQSNLLVNQFNQLLTKSSDYEAICLIFADFFKNLSSIKEESQKKIVSVNKLILPLRTVINKMNGQILSYGPQIFIKI